MDSGGGIIMNAGARIYVHAENLPAKYAPKKVSKYHRYTSGTHASDSLNMRTEKNKIATRKLSCTCYLYMRKRKLIRKKRQINGDKYS